MKYSGKRPVMFYQNGDVDKFNTVAFGDRIRIFYPDGKVDWVPLAPMMTLGSSISRINYHSFESIPCWMQDERPKNFNEAIRRANAFDKVQGFPKMEFLGEL